MNSNTKGLIAVLVVGGLAYFMYKRTMDSKAIVIRRLGKDFGKDVSHKSFVRSADKDYIKAWAEAIQNKQETFTYNNKNYFTKGGKEKK